MSAISYTTLQCLPNPKQAVMLANLNPADLLAQHSYMKLNLFRFDG